MYGGCVGSVKEFVVQHKTKTSSSRSTGCFAGYAVSTSTVSDSSASSTVSIVRPKY